MSELSELVVRLQAQNTKLKQSKEKLTLRVEELEEEAQARAAPPTQAKDTITIKDNEEVRVGIHKSMADRIYLALLDSQERLEKGTNQIQECINYFEADYNANGLGYERPLNIDLRCISSE